MENQVKKTEDRTRDQYTAVLEEINSKMSLLAEGQQMADEKFERFKVETEGNFKIVLDYLYRIDSELQDVKEEIKSLKIEFKDKAELERVIVLEKKVSMLEKILMKQKLLSV